MAETAGLEQARVEYRKTADALAKVTTGSQQTYNATFLAGRALEFARTCGDLAVRGIEEFAKASADYRRGEEERARAVFASTKMMGRWTILMAVATAIYAAGTVAFFVFQWRHPPAPVVVNVPVPTIILPPQQIRAPDQSTPQPPQSPTGGY